METLPGRRRSPLRHYLGVRSDHSTGMQLLGAGVSIRLARSKHLPNPGRGSQNQAPAGGLVSRSPQGWYPMPLAHPPLGSCLSGVWCTQRTTHQCAQPCPTVCSPKDVAHLAPLSMGFPRQEYWNSCHFLLQGIVPTQGLNTSLLNWQVILYHWVTWEALGAVKPVPNVRSFVLMKTGPL